MSQPFGSNRDSVSPLLDATTKNLSYLSADSSSRQSPYSKTQSESRNLIWSLAMIFASSKSLVPRFDLFTVSRSDRQRMLEVARESGRLDQIPMPMIECGRLSSTCGKTISCLNPHATPSQNRRTSAVQWLLPHIS